MNDFLQTATAAARAAGEVHKKYFHRHVETTEKSATCDRVSVADLEAEQTIVEIIRRDFPEHSILAEERGSEKCESPYLWIIDPLDGTNNFLHNLPIFSVSIALALDNHIILGVVYNPISDEFFSARRGEGAFLNGLPISVSRHTQLTQSLLITGFYYFRDERIDLILNDIRKFFSAGIVGIRRLGSAALDLCNVACGRAEGYWEVMLKPWDFAAGSLILEEAGGMITDVTGNRIGIESSYVVSSNGAIHSAMLAILA